MKSVIVIFLIVLSVNCFAQDSKILRTDHKYQFSIVEDTTCACVLPYTSYVAILSQDSTDAPVANVLHNDTGLTFDWYYDSTGNYYSDALPINSSAIVFSGSTYDYHCVRNTLYNGTFITISQAQYFWNDEYMPFDGFSNHQIEIRIYP